MSLWLTRNVERVSKELQSISGAMFWMDILAAMFWMDMGCIERGSILALGPR